MHFLNSSGTQIPGSSSIRLKSTTRGVEYVGEIVKYIVGHAESPCSAVYVDIRMR